MCTMLDDAFWEFKRHRNHDVVGKRYVGIGDAVEISILATGVPLAAS